MDLRRFYLFSTFLVFLSSTSLAQVPEQQIDQTMCTLLHLSGALSTSSETLTLTGDLKAAAQEAKSVLENYQQNKTQKTRVKKMLSGGLDAGLTLGTLAALIHSHRLEISGKNFESSAKVLLTEIEKSTEKEFLFAILDPSKDKYQVFEKLLPLDQNEIYLRESHKKILRLIAQDEKINELLGRLTHQVYVENASSNSLILKKPGERAIVFRELSNYIENPVSISQIKFHVKNSTHYGENVLAKFEEIMALEKGEKMLYRNAKNFRATAWITGAILLGAIIYQAIPGEDDVAPLTVKDLLQMQAPDLRAYFVTHPREVDRVLEFSEMAGCT